MEMPPQFEPYRHVGVMTHEGPCDVAHLPPARLRWWLRYYSEHGGMLRRLAWYAGVPYQRLRDLAYGTARTLRCDESLRISQRVYDETLLYSPVSWRARPHRFPQWVREESQKPGLGRPPTAFRRGAGLDLRTAGRVARLLLPTVLTPRHQHALATTLTTGGWTRRVVLIQGVRRRRWFSPALIPTVPL